MIDIVAAVNDEAVLAGNLLRSPLLAEPGASRHLHLRRGFSSAGRAYLDAMADCTCDLVVFVHQDVYLPAGWEARLREQVARVAGRDPGWGVLGVYGVGDDGRHAGCVWSSGLNRRLGTTFDEPVPVASLDEVLLVVRRDAGLCFDPKLPGYHLYATDLVQAARDRGRSAWVVCAPVIHNSRPVPFLRDDYFAAYRHVAEKWHDRLPIPTAVAPLLPAGPRYLALRARHRLLAWRHGGERAVRPDRGLDCVAVARALEFE